MRSMVPHAPTPSAPSPRRSQAANAHTKPPNDPAPDPRIWPKGPLIARDLFTEYEVERLIEAILLHAVSPPDGDAVKQARAERLEIAV